MLKIIPRGKYVLVKPDEVDSKENEYGLLTPSNEESEPKAYGKVEAVSKEIKDIKKGDKVIYGMYAGEEIKTKEKGKEVVYKLLHDDDIIAFLK